jgi:hypothetical protein
MLEDYLIREYQMVLLEPYKDFDVDALIYDYVADNLHTYFPPEEDYCPTESEGYFYHEGKYYFAKLGCDVEYEKSQSGHKVYYPTRLYKFTAKEIIKPEPKAKYFVALCGLTQEQVKELKSKYPNNIDFVKEV